MRFAFTLALFALASGISVLAQSKFARYDHGPVDFSEHKLIRIHPNAQEQLGVLRNLESDFEMDFWNPPMSDLRPVLTVVDPQREQFFLQALNRSHIPYEVAASNYQTIVDNEKAEMEMARAARNPNYDYENSYHTYAEITAQLKYLATQNSGRAEYINVGQTFQGREIPAIAVGTGSKVIFLECGIHSREWVTIAFGTWVANYLLTQASLQPLLSNYKFIIVPVVNVDGFVYTHTTNRLWRKTRSTQSGTTCVGADPNRNWDSAFCAQGASSNPCSETYCGRAAFSEVEAKLMSQLVDRYASQTAAYFAIHSYSQLWMYPWGYTNTLPPNAATLKSLSQAAIAAIRDNSGLVFTEGSIANAIYLASGSSADWVYDKKNVKISFAIELRDKGQYGFQLPANQIRPAVYETWAGLKAVIDRLS